jgi:hypothetical protein
MTGRVKLKNKNSGRDLQEVLHQYELIGAKLPVLK